MTPERPDVVILMTDEERAAPPYETDELAAWRREALPGAAWFDEHAVNFQRHYTGSLACVPSRPTLFTGHYPDLHGVTQTDGLGKTADDSRLRWLPEGEVPTLGNWFRAAGYDTHYDGKWHISHADLHDETDRRIRTNDSEGNVDAAAVQRYLDADPLAPYGFSGWVGPEPHGGAVADCGLRRDPLIAARVVDWLEDRYARRRAGEEAALRPFLLVTSFVNPHDIVLFPAWVRRGSPLEPSLLDPPPVPPAATAHEDLASKPAAQIAYRETYPSGYGVAPAVARAYRKNAQRYRDLYYRLHAEVDGPLDRVRRAVTEHGSESAVVVRTSDHGDLLGAHGGLHQKWFTLYDEATRVPFSIARVGRAATAGRRIDGAPTSHVDVVPTLLAAAGIDEAATADVLRRDFSEVHPLPGTDLMPVVDGATDADRDRAVYLMTRDNVLEGDSGASAMARRLGRTDNPPPPMRIRVPAHVGSNFEGLVHRVPPEAGGAGHLWKLVRTFDDPAAWTEPGVRHLAANGPGGDRYRTAALPDQWELYDLDDDPIEAVNRWHDESARDVFDHLRAVLKEERARAVPERNTPWPYVPRRPTGVPPSKRPPPPARLLRKVLQRIGLHPDDAEAVEFDLAGRRALVVATNTAVMDVGKPTGVFASEMTVPYYAFLDAGMDVDVASPLGGVIPVDPMSLKPAIRTEQDDRFLADDRLRNKVTDSLAIGDLDMVDYDLVFLAGGWGAAFDFGFSEALAEQMTEANAVGAIIGGVCHGPLGLRNARGADGAALVRGRRVTAVTDKQVRELGIDATPHHPETELRAMGAEFESETRFRDPLANHWVVDGNLVTGQNQNAGPMVAREMMRRLQEGTP
ncbi:MAG: sulfatase-like hydrolase/transferase [Ilumatobacter sp.]|nr:sulfatase-like hydrolase/transferase [Ilumatobacter sp.]MDJ0768987.1 sulfatase-like hydrolase/transferase [Ilumatobacter sp.]